MKSLRQFFRRAAREEDGTATIPFVMFAPFFLMLVVSSVEMGMMMIRSVMLERALDLTVRDLRLGIWTPTDNVAMAKRICNYAGILPNCSKTLLVELWTVSKATWSPLSTGAICVNRNALVQPATLFMTGTSNDMMIVRACLKVDPLFSGFGFGANMYKDATGAYSIVSTSAFVNEPRPGA